MSYWNNPPEKDYNHYFNQKEEVDCTVKYEDELEGEDGTIRPGIIITCNKCGHSEQSFGQSNKSIRRCLALLHENCPEGEDNFYIEE